MDKDHSAEAKILDAARSIFVEKGFNGCSSREIANQAGLNVALVNYYFKSKENLFHKVVSTILNEFAASIFDIFKSNLSLEHKTRIMIEHEYDLLSKHPEIPAFIIGELGKRNESFFQSLNFEMAIEQAEIHKQVIEAQNKGDMRKLDIVNILLLVMSNCHFPFMARPMINAVHSVNDTQYQDYLKIHKQYVTEMVINYLFPTK